MFQIADFVAKMYISSSKLEVCLPLAYPSNIYKHFSSLKPLQINLIFEALDVLVSSTFVRPSVALVFETEAVEQLSSLKEIISMK